MAVMIQLPFKTFLVEETKVLVIQKDWAQAGMCGRSTLSPCFTAVYVLKRDK